MPCSPPEIASRVKHVIRLGEDGAITAGQYVRIVRLAHTKPAAQFPRSFCGWWPVDWREILRQFRYGVNDRINRHLPVMPEWKPARIERQGMRRGLRSECHWCGRPLDFWTIDRRSHRCFYPAPDDCRRSYYS